MKFVTELRNAPYGAAYDNYLLRTYYAPITLLRTYYAPVTRLLRTYYAPITILRNYYAPITQLLRTYYAPIMKVTQVLRSFFF